MGDGARERFVVCGDDRIVVRVVEALMRQARPEDTDVVVVATPRSAFLDQLRTLGVDVIESEEPGAAAFSAARVTEATAVALLERDDVVNIHRALRVQDLAPDVRLVVRLYATALAGRIGLLLPRATVLSVSATAAPSFVNSAVGRAERQVVDLPGHRFVVAARDAVRDTDVVAGLARRSPAEPPVLLPADDAGTDLVIARLPVHESGRAVGTRRAALRRVVRASWGRVRAGLTPALARASLALVGLMVLGTVGFATLGGLSWGDAVYLTVLDAAGAADPDTHSSNVARTIQALVTVIGIALIPLVTAVVVDAAISARFEGAAQRSRPRRDHVVVVGLGSVGVRVVEQLRARRVRVVGVDGDDERPGIAAVRRMGVPVIVGDPAREQTLVEASTASCRALVVVTADDIVNLETGLVGRSLRGTLRVVLRLRDDDLARRVERVLHPATSRSVSSVAAPVFAAAMRDRRVVATVPVGRAVLVVADVPIGRSARLAGLLPAAAAIDGEVRVLGVFKGGGPDALLEMPPRPQRPLRAGDRLVVVATRDGLTEVHALCAARSG